MHVWVQYLRSIGSMQWKDQCNGKSERFNCMLNLLLTKSVNNNAAVWEGHVADALSAYRKSVSTVTGYMCNELGVCEGLEGQYHTTMDKHNP